MDQSDFVKCVNLSFEIQICPSAYLICNQNKNVTHMRLLESSSGSDAIYRMGHIMACVKYTIAGIQQGPPSPNQIKIS